MIGSKLPKLKTASNESHFRHCVLLELIVSLLTKRFQEFNLSVKGGVHIKQMTASKGGSKSNLRENCQISSKVEL